MDKRLINFWSVLQNKALFDSFRHVMDVTPFAELEFESAAEVLDGATPDIDYRLATGINNPHAATAVARACAFFVRCRQSLAGRMKHFAPLSKTRVRRGMNEQASAWLTAIEGLPEVHARLKRVVILNGNALDVIEQQDGPHTLFYLDPPYHPATRAAPEVYRHEADLEHHRWLLEYLINIKGKAILSGYDNVMYNEWLHDWHRAEFDLPNNAAGGKEKRRMTEVL